jgi:hypothetical protein
VSFKSSGDAGSVDYWKVRETAAHSLQLLQQKIEKAFDDGDLYVNDDGVI